MIDLKIFDIINSAQDKFHLFLNEEQVNEITNEVLGALVSEKISPEVNDLMCHKAEQQIYGFRKANDGWQWRDLLQGMAISRIEWEVLKKDFALGYLTQNDIDEIDKFFDGLGK